MAGCKSIGADGCKSSGRRKSNLRRRRDARGSEAESAGGWSSAAAVQRIPHPALLPAPGSLGHTQYVRGFSSWDCCYGKTPQQAFRHPGRRFPLGFIAWGGSRHRRVWVKGIADSSSGSSRMERCPQHNEPCWVVLLAGLWDGQSWGEPQHDAGGGTPSQPPSSAVTSAQPRGRGSAALCTRPCSKRSILGSRNSLTGSVGTTFAPHLRALQHPAHPGSWKSSLLLQTPCLAGRPKKSLSLIFPLLPDSTYCLGGDFFTTTTPGSAGGGLGTGWHRATGTRNSEQPPGVEPQGRHVFWVALVGSQ